jgi:hypothetical protein
MGVGCWLLILRFIIVLVYPPAGAVVVPLFTFKWIVYYLNREQRRGQ